MPEISNLFAWLVLGGLSGWIASKITGRDDQMGAGLNLIVGIIGAFIGGWLAGIFGLGPATGFNLWSIVISVLGAVIFLSVVKAFQNKQK